MRRLFTGSKKTLLFSGIIGALFAGFFSLSAVFAAPASSPPGATSQIEVDPEAPEGSLIIQGVDTSTPPDGISDEGVITSGVWQGSVIEMLYGGTEFSTGTAAGVRTGLGIAKSGANTDISSINSPNSPQVLTLNPTGAVGVQSLAPSVFMSTYAPTGGSPQNIAFDGTNMWTANFGGNSVTKVTPSGTMTTYTGTGTFPYGIAFDGTNMWTVNNGGNSVTKITPSGVMTTYTGLGANPYGIAFDGTNMWTANNSANSVTKVTPSGVMTTYAGTGANPFVIAFDGTNMWTANTSNSVTKITPSGVMTTYTGTGSAPHSIAFDGTNMWTANSSSNSVTKITPSGVMTTYTGTGVSPASIAFDGINMWTANSGGVNSVTKITPSGVMTTYTGAGSQPYGIAFDGTNIWTSNAAGNSVTKVTLSGHGLDVENGKFRVDSAGNISKINNIPYSWPSAQGGAGSLLTNNGTGGLSWYVPGSTSIAVAGWTDDPPNNYLYVTSPGRLVGIGTTTPSERLHVVGNINISDGSMFKIYSSYSGQIYPYIHVGGASAAATQSFFAGSAAGVSWTTSGTANTGVGSGALVDSMANNNTALGYRADVSNITGTGGNTAAGYEAMFENNIGPGSVTCVTVPPPGTCHTTPGTNTGANNTAVGSSALAINNGDGNVAVGNDAGNFYPAGSPEPSSPSRTGNNNTFIGYQAGNATPVNLTNATAIGANAQVTQSDSLILGDVIAFTSVGIGASEPIGLLSVGVGASPPTPPFVALTDGDLGRIHDVRYRWPNTQGAALTYLTSLGGPLQWAGLSSSGGAGGWTENVPGNQIYTTNIVRNVGVSTTNPGSKLTVWNSTAGNAFAIRNVGDSSNTLTIDTTGTLLTGLVPWARLAFSGVVTPKSATLPVARGQFSCAEDSSINKIYCFGGYNYSGGTSSNQILEYTPATDTLVIKSATLPSVRDGSSCAENSSTHKIYCFGGGGIAPLSQITEYTPATNTLIIKIATLPSARFAPSCSENSSTHKIYCFGGYDYGLGAPTDQIVEYNPATDTLAIKSALLPVGRYESSCSEDILTHKIYCFGGFDYGGGLGAFADQITEYSPATDTLVIKSASVSPDRIRLGCSRNSSTSKIYCFGGHDGISPYSDQIFEYNPATNTFTPDTATLPTGRESHSCAEDSSTHKIYCFGGNDSGGGLNQIFEYADPSITFGCPSGQLLKKIGATLTCASPGTSSNGWTENVGLNIVHTTTPSRKVGIGTSSPLAMLHVVPTGTTGFGPDQTPLQSTPSGGGANAVAGASDYSMGYRFTPIVNGQITKLGARCDSNGRLLELYDAATSASLLTAPLPVTTTGTNTWVYQTLPAPVPVVAGHSYVVAVQTPKYKAVTGCVATHPPLPPVPCPPDPPPPPPPNWCKALFSTATTSGDITINESRYEIGGSGFPYSSDTTYMFGQADVVFQKDLSSGVTAAVIEEKTGIDMTPAGTSKLAVNGAIHSLAGGLKFPDGTIQPTAGFTGGSGGFTNYLVKRSSSSSTVLTNSLLTFNSGNVGVNVGSSPSAPLHVKDGIVSSEYGGGYYVPGGAGTLSSPGIFGSYYVGDYAYGAVQGDIYGSIFGLTSSNSALYGKVTSGPASGLLINQAGTGNIAKFTGTGTTIIDNLGNWGVGNSAAPAAKLEVTNSTSNALRIRGDSGTPPPPPFYTYVTAGGGHTCAEISGSPEIKCWGYNGYGQFGNGGTASSLTPVPSPMPPLSWLDAGNNLDTCAVFPGNQAFCWGSNVYGQLGNGSYSPPFSPGPIPVIGPGGSPPLTNVTQISGGGGHGHTCARLSTGEAVCWGRNISAPGTLGDGTTTDSLTPVYVVATTAFGPHLTGVSFVSAGGEHTCALISGGTVKCWGQGGNGQLGNGATANSTIPVTVSGIGSTPVNPASQISTGFNHTCAIVQNTSLLSPPPPPIVQCWGNNSYGQLGNGTTTDSPVPVTVSFGGTANPVTVEAGYGHTCARMSDSTVQCWGYNSNGQLGNNSTVNSLTPVVVMGTGAVGTLTGVNQISAGNQYTCAVMSGGTIKCWGGNGGGALGDGTTTDRWTPVAVVTPATSSGGGSVDIFPAVGPPTPNKSGTQNCQDVSSTAICLAAWDSTGSGGGGSTINETPLAAQGMVAATTGSTGYSMGYRFTPSVSGTITQLGFRCTSGTRTVALYSTSSPYSVGSFMTSASVTSTGTGTWNYTSITPVAVTAGQSYVVATTSNASTYCYNAKTTPFTAASGLVVNDSRYFSGSGFPTSVDNTTMYGEADVNFQYTGGGGVTCSTSIANGRATCADFGD